jgi:predicted choloylglycine hydrolase
MSTVPLAPFTFRALAEAQPGPIWAGLFAERWPAYRDWFLQEGDAARPSYGAAVGMLAEHMPELIPTFERLCALAGGGDLAARMLALVEPPPFLSACSQGVIAGPDGPVLVRNYDYLAERLEGVLWWTAWTRGRVIGMSDLLWGLLDGMNDDGLAVSLTFGGRRAHGRGFGIPLVVRYLLETCRDVREATDALDRLPYQLAHNLTLVDAAGEVVTAYLAPDRRPVFARTPVATNHQDVLDWPEYTALTRSHEREGLVRALLDDPAMTPERFVEAFLVPPLRDSAGNGHFGTLYTAVFHPRAGRVEYRWPGSTWRQSFDDFAPGSHAELLPASLGPR